MGYNVHDVLNKIVVYITLNTKLACNFLKIRFSSVIVFVGDETACMHLSGLFEIRFKIHNSQLQLLNFDYLCA
jgi:hypothetical protein